MTDGGGIVVAIDLGTGGPKTALVALTGEVLDAEHRRADPRVSADGAAVQDPAEWWTAVVSGISTLTARHPEAAARAIAVAVTGQWGSTVPVDDAGAPVGDCMLWMDGRGRALAQAHLGGRLAIEGFAPRKAIEWIRRSGGAPSPEGNDPLGHRLWIRHHEPDLDRRTATFLEPIDWLNAQLTGRVAASPVSMLLSWLTDNRHPDRAEYDAVLLGLAGEDPARLPELIPTGSTVGPLLADLAATLGLPAGLPVVTALPDLHSAALGSGAVAAHHAHLSISTSAWIGCHTPTKRTSLTKQMATVPAALSGRYLLANNHETAGVCMEWLRDTLLVAEDGLTTPGATGFADLDAVAASAPSGAGGVLFTPWLNGERSPVADTNLRAGFLNLSLATTRAEMVRSVLEGVAHNARWLLEASEAVLKADLGAVPIRAIGGGAQSDVWCQIHADVLGRPIERVDAPLYANVRGAAFFAGLCLGLLDEADVAARVAVDRTFRPDPASRSVHDAHHREFTALAKAQKAMYRRLNGPRP